MKVSFVIVNYNGAETLEMCIASLKQQNFDKEEMEIILVDNNSPDKSVDKIKPEKMIKIIRNKENLGFAGGNNVGIKQSKGEFVALINNDVTLKKDWTKKMIEKIESDEKIGIVGSKILYYSSKKLWFGGGKIVFPGFAKHMDYPSEREVDYLAFASIIFRNNMKNAKYLDENLFLYGEDSEMCKRIKKMGFKVVYFPEAIAYHHIKEDRISANEEYYISRNRAYYYTKFYNLPGKVIFCIFDIVLFYQVFLIYRIMKDPRRIKFIWKIIKARVDSIPLMFK